MHICIIGAGAIGIFLAAQLRPYVRITLLDHNESEFATQLVEVMGFLPRRVKVDVRPSNVCDVSDADLIMVTTKATHLEPVIDILENCKVPVVFWQNGIGITHLIRDRLQGIPLIRALIWAEVNRENHRLVTCHGFSRIVLGSVQGDADPVPLAVTLTEAGLKTEIARDIDYAEWEKSLWSIGVSGLCAIIGERNGSIVESSYLRELLIGLIREAQMVARAIGYTFDSEESVIRQTHATALNMNTMLLDIMKQRQTEIEYLNGYVMRLGAQYRIETPNNAFVYRLVKHIESRNLPY